jgi:hypothetical protein
MPRLIEIPCSVEQTSRRRKPGPLMAVDMQSAVQSVLNERTGDVIFRLRRTHAGWRPVLFLPPVLIPAVVWWCSHGLSNTSAAAHAIFNAWYAAPESLTGSSPNRYISNLRGIRVPKHEEIFRRNIEADGVSFLHKTARPDYWKEQVSRFPRWSRKFIRTEFHRTESEACIGIGSAAKWRINPEPPEKCNRARSCRVLWPVSDHIKNTTSCFAAVKRRGN